MPLGSGDGGAKVPSAMEEAQAQIALERERAKLAADQAAATKAQQDADYANKVNKAKLKQDAGYDAAVQYGDRQTSARGLDQGLVDQYGISDLFRSTLDSKRGTFAEDDLNPLYGEATAYSDALASGTGRYRSDIRNQFDTAAGSSSNIFADTMDDSILNAILGGQREDTLTQINAARDRGQLNSSGYNKALQKLDAQGKSASSQLQDLGRGVLTGYRTQYDTLADNTRNKIGSADLTRAFDVGGATSALDQLRQSLGGRLEGDLYRATDGQSFFDPNSILSYGKSQQGFINPSQSSVGGDNPLLTAFTDPNAKKKSSTSLSTTGSNGAF